MRNTTDFYHPGHCEAYVYGVIYTWTPIDQREMYSQAMSQRTQGLTKRLTLELNSRRC